MEAEAALISMRRMENAEDRTFSFVNTALGGGLGKSGDLTARIDVSAIGAARSSGIAVNVASTLVHEAGHLYYQNTSMYALRPDGEASAFNAMSWDNAYRRSVRMRERDDHHSYPRRP